MADRDITFPWDADATIRLFPDQRYGLSLSTWATHVKTPTQQAAPNKGRYDATTNDTYRFYMIFEGSSQPSDWGLWLAVIDTVAASATEPPVDVTPSDPDRVTAYYLCLDEEGEPAAGVIVTLQASEPISTVTTPTGLLIDKTERSGTSGVDGVVEFINVVPGFRYRVGLADGGSFVVPVPYDAADPYPLQSIVG